MMHFLKLFFVNIFRFKAVCFYYIFFDTILNEKHKEKFDFYYRKKYFIWSENVRTEFYAVFTE